MYLNNGFKDHIKTSLGHLTPEKKKKEFRVFTIFQESEGTTAKFAYVLHVRECFFLQHLGNFGSCLGTQGAHVFVLIMLFWRIGTF